LSSWRAFNPAHRLKDKQLHIIIGLLPATIGPERPSFGYSMSVLPVICFGCPLRGLNLDRLAFYALLITFLAGLIYIART
jgi:hypothetical protein